MLRSIAKQSGETVLCALCPHVRLLQAGIVLKRMTWFFSWGLLSTSPAPCYKEIQVPENLGTSVGNFVRKSGRRKFHHVTSIIAMCCQQRWTLRARCRCLGQMVNRAVNCLESRYMTALLTIWPDMYNALLV